MLLHFTNSARKKSFMLSQINSVLLHFQPFQKTQVLYLEKNISKRDANKERNAMNT